MKREDIEKGFERQTYTKANWISVALVLSTVIPLVAVRFLGVAGGRPFATAAAIGVAILGAAFALSWGVEGLEKVVPPGAALAILALIEVAPEYSFEVIFAYRQQTTLAAASMTGANRLLLGLGWPLIMLTAWAAARRKGKSALTIDVGQEHAGQVVFLMVASLYAFVMVIKRSVSLIDAAVLAGIYIAYVVASLRRDPGEAEENDSSEVGVGARTKELRPVARWIATGSFLAFGAFVLYTGAEPFIDAALRAAKTLGVSDFVLIQWIAPFLSEFPESLTAFIWAATVVAAPMGLASLMSSKLNQWTLLFATIPIAFSVGAGHVSALPFDAQVRDEVFLTAAQSLFGSSLLLTMRLTRAKAVVLLLPFLAQFFIPLEPVRVALAWCYLVMTVVYLLVARRRLVAFSAFKRQVFGER